jgi:hypothetical protein
VNAADIKRGIRKTDINLEIADAAQKIRGIQIPAFTGGHVGRAGDDTKADEA